MKKAFFICIFLLLIILTEFKINSQTTMDIKGQVVLANPNINGNDYSGGILIYTPNNRNYLYLSKNTTYRDVSFSKNKEQILGVSGDTKIIEYDLKTGTPQQIFQGNKNEASYSNVKYVPNSTMISFDSDKLYVYDWKTKIKKEITEIFGDYSFSKDGTKLFYSFDGEIFCLDILKNKKIKLFNGGSCQLSNSNKYIAFISGSFEITVYEIKTGKKWRRKGITTIEYFKFSPDDKYLAIMQGYPFKSYYYGKDIIGWDFKKNNEITIIEHINRDSYCNFDWK